MADFIVIAVVIAIVGGASAYIYKAKKNESFYFTPKYKHYITSKQGAKILWVSSPPSF